MSPVAHINPKKYRDHAFGVAAHTLSWLVPQAVRLMVFELAMTATKAEGASEAELRAVGDELISLLLPEREGGKYDEVQDNNNLMPLIGQILLEHFPALALHAPPEEPPPPKESTDVSKQGAQRRAVRKPPRSPT